MRGGLSLTVDNKLRPIGLRKILYPTRTRSIPKEESEPQSNSHIRLPILRSEDKIALRVVDH